MEDQMPEEIRKCRDSVVRLVKINDPSSEEKKLLSIAQLKLAVWSCEQEGLRPSRANLEMVLGVDAEAALKYYGEVMDW